MPADDDYLSPKEAAAIYRVSTQTILRLIARGRIPAVKLTARTWRIRRRDLDAAFSSTPPPSAPSAPPRPRRPPRRPTRGK